MELRLLLLPVSFKAKYMVMVLGSIAIYSGFRSAPGDNTAHLAHLGGIVMAIILIQFWMRRR
jgi:membrane associated rhomboid family serine protease